MATEALEVVETPPVVADPAPVEAVTPPAPEAPKAPVVPEKYELKVPDGVTVDPAVVERTAAKARALGLSNEAGQQLLEADLAEHAAREAARKTEYDAFVKAWEPGGAEYERQKADWITQAMKDPAVVGPNPTPDGFKAIASEAQRVLAAYGSPDLTKLLEKEGFIYHPTVLGFLMNLARRTSEGRLVLGGTPAATEPRSAIDILYGKKPAA